MSSLTSPDAASADPKARQAWLSLLARAPSTSVLRVWNAAKLAPDHIDLRAPEVGAVMVRGRAGAVGAPFNLGEMSVTRASVRLRCGAIGHGYAQGRSTAHARIAALVDALMQTQVADAVRQAVLCPLEAEMSSAREARASRAAATKVEFFTLVRGED
ncbi:MAG: phosphonate C-P lyase system protein PhnG [Pseudomonadota bacterium]